MSVLSATPSKAAFEEAAQTLGVNESFIEKDWYAVQAIAALAKINSSSNLKKSIIKSLQSAGFMIRDQDVLARDENRFFSIKIEYETQFSRSNALRPYILVEMALQNPQLPFIKLNIQSFVAKNLNQLSEVEKISCVSPIEIAADKLSAIVWRIPDRIRGELYDDPAIVRHIHDLFMLEPVISGENVFVELVKETIQKDNRRSKKNKNFSKMTLEEKFNQLFKVIDNDAEYMNEYSRFVKNVSYAPQELIPDFLAALMAVRRLADFALTQKFSLEPLRV